MRVRKEVPGDTEPVALVFTGEGSSEFRRLRPVAEKFDEDDLLFFPTNPNRGMRIVGKRRQPTPGEKHGLSALESLRVFKGRFDYSRFVFLVDLEHFEGRAPSALADELRGELTSVASDDPRVESLNERAFRCECQIGSADVTMLTAVMGDEHGCIEDCVANLLQREWGNRIDADDRDDLKTTLRDVFTDTREREFIESAARQNVEAAFPGLSAVLQTYEC